MTWVVITMIAGNFFLSIDMYTSKEKCEEAVAQVEAVGQRAICKELPKQVSE